MVLGNLVAVAQPCQMRQSDRIWPVKSTVACSGLARARRQPAREPIQTLRGGDLDPSFKDLGKAQRQRPTGPDSRRSA